MSTARRRWLVSGLLLAFVTMGVAAALPHTHTHRPEAAHACVMCRAQTAQPQVAPPAVPTPTLQRGADIILPAVLALVSQGLVVLPESRAPPAIA